MVFYALLTAQRSSRSGASRGRRAAAPVISAGWRGRAGGDAAAPVIELRTAPFRYTLRRLPDSSFSASSVSLASLRGRDERTR